MGGKIKPDLATALNHSKDKIRTSKKQNEWHDKDANLQSNSCALHGFKWDESVLFLPVSTSQEAWSATWQAYKHGIFSSKQLQGSTIRINLR